MEPPAPPPGAVSIQLKFVHDFFPEETMFTIRSLDRDVVEYAGPQYVPAREDAWSSTFELVPGRYAVEIFDKNGDGLFSGSLGSRNGAWQLVALYDNGGGAETELATGDSGFFINQIQEFVVANRPLESCMSKKFLEEQIGEALGVVCECNTGSQGQVDLVCRNNSDEVCAINHAPCGPTSSGGLDCCGNHQCNSGLCRTATKGSGKTSVSRLDEGSGGAGGRLNRGGNLRRLRDGW